MARGAGVVLMLAGCGGVGAVDTAAWTAGRIVYADGSGLRAVDADGAGDGVLLKASGATCPAVSGDGATLAVALDDRVLVASADGAITFVATLGGTASDVAVNADGTTIVFTEVDGDEAAGPARLLRAATDGAEDPEPAVDAAGVRAELAEWSADGDDVSYLRTEDGTASVCLLDDAAAAADCLSLRSPGRRAWSPSGRVILDDDLAGFDVRESLLAPDPYATETGGTPTLTSNDALRDAVVAAAGDAGWALLPAASGRATLGVAWSPDDVLLFPAMAEPTGGGSARAVQLFTYDLASGVATHVTGPIDPEACARWIP